MIEQKSNGEQNDEQFAERYPAAAETEAHNTYYAPASCACGR
jgi:hypothetical protein